MTTITDGRTWSEALEHAYGDSSTAEDLADYLAADLLEARAMVKAVISRPSVIRRAMLLLPPFLAATHSSFRSTHPQDGLRTLLLSCYDRGLFGPRKVTMDYQSADEPDWPTITWLEIYYRLEIDFCRCLKPLEQMSSQQSSGTWKKMLLSRPLCDEVLIVFRKHGHELLLDMTLTENHGMTLGEMWERLRGVHAATVASENWRIYVDHETTFEKHIDRITPSKCACEGRETESHLEMLHTIALIRD